MSARKAVAESLDIQPHPSELASWTLYQGWRPPWRGKARAGFEARSARTRVGLCGDRVETGAPLRRLARSAPPRSSSCIISGRVSVRTLERFPLSSGTTRARRSYTFDPMTRALVDHVTRSSSESHVVVGDLNSTPLWPAYRRIASHLTDAAVAVAKKRSRPAEPTWGPLGRGKWFRIDHGFVRGVSVEDFQVVELHVSDHSAIVMDLSF